jgi:hypothetical protein
MHRFFNINELIALVLSHLQSYEPDLSRVARTSKLFNAAALPLLWRELLSVVPLLRLLPDDAVTFTRHHEDDDWVIVSCFQVDCHLGIPLNSSFLGCGAKYLQQRVA